MSLYLQMDSPISFLTSIPTITFFFFFFFLTTLPPQSHCCPPYNCGNLRNISFPFFGENQPDFCRRPGFGLECVDNHITKLIGLHSQIFIVFDINQTDHRMRMVPEFVYNPGVCPFDYNNTFLSPNLFKYPTTVHNISIFYNCSRGFSIGGNNISCGADRQGFYVDENRLRDYPQLRNCSCHIQVPAMQPIRLQPAGGINALHEALDDGFDVHYNMTDCNEFWKSGGVCGTGKDAPSNSCCKPQPSSSPQPNPSTDSHSLNWKRKVIIGVSAAVVGALSVSIVFYFYLRRKKNRYAASYMQSRSLSSDPSLKDDPEKGSKYFGVHVFTYSELEEATNNFDSNRELGDGGFGTVYFGILQDGRQVAVKRLYENNYRRLEQFMNEVEILTRLRHQNLVSLYGCTSRHSRELLLVYEYISNGTVADHLHGRRAKAGTLTWDIRMNIATETASALKYLHASDIIHRDVKTNNILLDNHFVVKVADFGLSRLFPNDVTHISTAPQGTPGYVDPEYHECYQLTDKSDVYSFGVVLIELISSMPAVDITRHRHEINLSNMAINKIQNRALHELVDPSLGFESDYKVRKMINGVAELAFQCLQNLKDMRPSMEEVVERLKDIQNDGKSKTKADEMDITAADDVVLLKNEPPPASPDSNVRSTSTTPNASG